MFLTHPGQTQAITYISQRVESMATLFYLSSFYFYIQARIMRFNLQKIFLFTVCGLLAVLGILTKEIVVTIPLMILSAEFILWPKEFDSFINSIKNPSKSNFVKICFVFKIGRAHV